MSYQTLSDDDTDGFIPTQLNATNKTFSYPAGSSSQPNNFEIKELNTLDEPITETIKRDLKNIWDKIKLVLIPKGQKDILKNWDLWGPLLLCLMLSLTLSISEASQSGAIFSGIFIIIPFGSAVITLNAQLLGGKLSFFQTACVLGYCIFPVNLASIVCAVLPRRGVLPLVIRLVVVGISLVWCIFAATGFLQADIGISKKRALVMFPIFLFYFSLCFMVLVFSATFSYSADELINDGSNNNNNSGKNSTMQLF